MTLNSIKQVVEAELAGKVRLNMWRKTPTAIGTGGVWFDLAMSPGLPTPKYWFDATPLVAKQISQSADGGLYHGPSVSPSQKYLRQLTTSYQSATGIPIYLMLCDYLIYYPSCDDSTTDPQVMDNTVTLPRYTDGKGVQMLAVSVAARTGGQSFYVTYTNSDGVAGRTSQTVVQTLSSVNGQVQCGSTSSAISSTPFIGLQSGDTGVRSIQSVTMLGLDTGLFSLILVKPIATTIIKEQATYYEKDFYLQDGILPRIYDDAFLNFVVLPQSSVVNPFIGDIKIIWD